MLIEMLILALNGDEETFRAMFYNHIKGICVLSAMCCLFCNHSAKEDISSRTFSSTVPANDRYCENIYSLKAL